MLFQCVRQQTRHRCRDATGWERNEPGLAFKHFNRAGSLPIVRTDAVSDSWLRGAVNARSGSRTGSLLAERSTANRTGDVVPS